MAGNLLGIGIIGCGMISNWHADTILKIDGARLAGAADLNEAARNTFCRKYGIRAFESVEEMLCSDEIQIVNICTPSGLHAPLAIKAANAGKHVIIEKPMALNLREADDIISACEKNQVKMEVISQLRFNESVGKLKNAVDHGMLGKLVSGDVYMKYYRSQEYYDRGGWRGTKKMDGGGALMNQGIHGIDLLLYIMGPVKNVFANTRTLVRRIEVEDTAAALLEFKNGALGVIQGTTSVFPGSPRRLEVSGDKGTIIIEEDAILSWNIEGGEAPKDIKIGHAKTSSANNPSNFGIEGHVRQISDMLDAVRYDRKPLVDQYEGRKPIELIMAIYESSRTGKLVKL